MILLNAIRAEYGKCWAITQDMLEVFAGIDVDAMPAVAKVPRLPSIKGSIGVLPLTGPITQRGGGLMQMFFGGTSTDAFGAAFDSMMADDSVGAILMDVDSPGGGVYGVDELGTKIREARGTKPIVAVANSMAASAAYWLAAQADQLFVTPGGDVGSVGVYMLHADFSEALAMDGVKPTFISAGKHKVEGNQFEPLSDEAREQFQTEVDRYYDMFVGAVAKGRGATASAVKRDFGQGRLVGAKDAVAAGMADGVASFDEVLMGMLAKQKGRGRSAAGTYGAPAVVGNVVISSQGAALEILPEVEADEDENEEEDDKATPLRDAAEDRLRDARWA